MDNTGHTNNTTVTLFDDYLAEYRKHIQQVELHLRDGSKNKSDDALQSLQTCERILLPQMKAETRSGDIDSSSLKQDRIDTYKACRMQLKTYQMMLLTDERDDSLANAGPCPLPTNTNTRQQCSASSSDMNYLTNSRPKERLKQSKDRVENQNERLSDAMRSIRETEELAGGITEELQRNRATLENTQSTVGELSGMVSQANGHLKNMIKKQKRWF